MRSCIADSVEMRIVLDVDVSLSYIFSFRQIRRKRKGYIHANFVEEKSGFFVKK